VATIHRRHPAPEPGGDHAGRRRGTGRSAGGAVGRAGPGRPVLSVLAVPGPGLQLAAVRRLLRLVLRPAGGGAGPGGRAGPATTARPPRDRGRAGRRRGRRAPGPADGLAALLPVGRGPGLSRRRRVRAAVPDPVARGDAGPDGTDDAPARPQPAVGAP